MYENKPTETETEAQTQHPITVHWDQLCTQIIIYCTASEARLLCVCMTAGRQSQAGRIFSSLLKIQSCHNAPASARQANWICGDWYRAGMTAPLTRLNLSKASSLQPWQNKSNAAAGRLIGVWEPHAGGSWCYLGRRNAAYTDLQYWSKVWNHSAYSFL